MTPLDLAELRRHRNSIVYLDEWERRPNGTLQRKVAPPGTAAAYRQREASERYNAAVTPDGEGGAA